MKHTKKLLCLCLIAVLMLSLLAIGVQAATIAYMYVYTGSKPLVTDDSIPSSVIEVRYDSSAPFTYHKIENLYAGGDLTSWKLWAVDSNIGKTKGYMSLAVDFVYDDLDISAGIPSFDGMNDVLMLEPVINRKYWITQQPTAKNPHVSTNVTASPTAGARRFSLILKW